MDGEPVFWGEGEEEAVYYRVGGVVCGGDAGEGGGVEGGQGGKVNKRLFPGGVGAGEDRKDDL
jgi:hypothetical protein